jgi:hypothetical protein
MEEWIENVVYITMGLYSAIKKNEMKLWRKKCEIILFGGKQMELDIIMLSKITQSHKDKYHIFSLIWS